MDLSGLQAAAEQGVAKAKSESTALGQVVDAQKESFTKLADLKPAENPAAAVAAVGGALLGAAGMAGELTNTGIAVLTNSVSAMLPAFPAAHLGSFYLGIPHAHAHPPSFIAPVPPVPLPTMGAITLGTSMQVLVQGLPAARAGDLGLAPTCGGIVPFFTVFLASSKVFFGGTRAARQTDMCTACTPSADTGTRATAAAMKAASKAQMLGNMAQMALDGLDKLGKVVQVAGIASSAIEAYNANEASEKAEAEASSAQSEAAAAEAAADAQEQGAMAAANAISAGMAAGQMAADAAATALSAAMGTDRAIPPGMIGFVTLGASRVLVGGMPMPNIPDPAQWLLKKLAAKAKPKGRNSAQEGGGGGCPKSR
jgi:uncharacterized Zn-binding protein involved in type VI secretion